MQKTSGREALLDYEPVYHQIILHRVKQLVRISSGFEAANDLGFPHVLPIVGDKVENSFIEVGGAESSSTEEDKAPKSRNLGTAVAPEEAVMLPQDVADLTVEDSLEACDLMSLKIAMTNSERIRKHSSKLKKAQKRVGNLKDNLKKANENLDAEVEDHEASNDIAMKSLIKVDASREKMDKALYDLAKVQKVATGPVASNMDYGSTREERGEGEVEVGDVGVANNLRTIAGEEKAGAGSQDIPMKCVDTSFSSVDTSNLLPLVKAYYLLVSTLHVPGVNT
ncbi:hypothetical protein Acr_18g0011890 [Actinidia rufa]|uniref:Uncharacterized protein n=1 Tax=Actinidia rufa TaxID=165716 RepID=A0A7J0G8B2_9ERIC|nr:hypothetical protein Acr_18g0011890 [Actinidia rufa]